MSATVESDRLVLLTKAEAAFTSAEDAKSIRILQRIIDQTSGPTTATPSTPSTSINSSTTSSSSTTTTAAITLPPHIPIVLPPTPTVPSPSTNESQTGGSFTLPLLAPSLHAASSATTSTQSNVVLPSAQQPPLFLMYHNIGLIHLRARKLKLSQIYLTRSLESGQALYNALATAIPTSSPTSNRSMSSSSDERLPVPGATLSSSSKSRSTSPNRGGHLASSPSTRTTLTHSLSHHALTNGRANGLTAAPSTGANPVASFILKKQFQVFYHTGLVLLQAHPTVTDNLNLDVIQYGVNGLQLAYRCFRHCLHLQQTDSVSLIDELIHPCFLHLRAGESLIALDQHRQQLTQVQSNSIPPSTSTTVASPSEFPLDLSIDHFQQSLTQLKSLPNNQTQPTSPSSSTSTPSSESTKSQLQVEIALKLAYVYRALKQPLPSMLL